MRFYWPQLLYPTIVSTIFPFLFFLSIRWYCGAGVFRLIGLISLPFSLALPTWFNSNNKKKLLDRNVLLNIFYNLFFGVESKSLWYDGVTHYNDIPFFKWNQARGQLLPLLYNVYTDDLNHHLQATRVGWDVGGAWVNSLSYADDMVLLAPTVTTLPTILKSVTTATISESRTLISSALYK